MAVITFSDTGFDLTASITTLFDQVELTAKSSTVAEYTNRSTSGADGHKLRLTGTGFAFDQNFATSGTIKKVEIFDPQGNLVVTMTPGATGFLNNSLNSFAISIGVTDEIGALDKLLGKADTFNGSAGGETLEAFGEQSFDTLNGNGGDDRLLSSFPATAVPVKLDGGAGIDQAFIVRSSSDDGFLVDISNPNVERVLVDGTRLVRVERLQFIGGTGDDSLTGGALDDLLDGFDGRDRLNGAGGNDILTAYGNSTILGGAGDDRLTHGNSFNGNITAALMDGGAGIDQLVLDRDAGDKAIVLDISNPNVERTLADGTRIIRIESIQVQGTGKADRVVGGALSDFFSGNDGNDTFNGGAGDDFVNGGLGRDRLEGGLGSDFLSFSTIFGQTDFSVALTLKGANTAVAVVNGVAQDTVSGFENVEGGVGNDTISGDGLDNQLNGGRGIDILRGFGGNDRLVSDAAGERMEGGAGEDRIAISRTSATVNLALNLTNPNAVQNLGDGTTIVGFERLSVNSGSGNDRFTGGALDDSFSGGAGKDTLNGAGGVDSADYGEKTEAVVVTLKGAAAVAVKVGAANEDTISGIENIRGGRGHDRLTGDSAANELWGNNGNDSLAGAAGNDELIGDFGFSTAGSMPSRDTLSGGAGADTLDGGVDMDTAVYSEKTARILVTLAGNDSVGVSVGGALEDTIVNIENITAGAGNDELNGDGFSNVFIGNGGNDLLQGLAGNDTLTGGAGNDTLSGGLGSDRLTGGGGRDVAVFAGTSWGGDIYADFQDGTDLLQFKRAIADNVSDFTIAGNGTGNVRLTIGAQTLTIFGIGPVTITNADLQFLA